jgi:RimJ/RimL family protein N-acetyltransferase
VFLREVIDADLPVFYRHQQDPEASRMAAFPIREVEPFMAHWAKIRSDPTVLARTILYREAVAGNVGSYDQDGTRLVGYWIGRAFWGQGVATRALTAFLSIDRHRPLVAHVAQSNRASIRVLEKCGFKAIRVELGVSIGGGPAVDETIMELGP